MNKQWAENRRVSYGNRVLEHTHNQLLLPQVQDNLGDTALTLLATLENVRALPLTHQGKERVLTLPGYEETSIIPMVMLKENETIRNEMYAPTPEQYTVVDELDIDPSDPFGPALRENYYVPLDLQYHKFSDANMAATYTPRATGRFMRNGQVLTTIHEYRPLISLNYDQRRLDIGHVATTLAHELSHVTDSLQQPVTDESEEDLLLGGELRAFKAQYEILRAAIKRERGEPKPLAFAVEAVRRRVNGPVYDNPYAFAPSQALKDELEAQDLSYIYQ